MITNHMSTAELQKLDAAHHMHPFTDANGLAAKGARVITRGEGVWLTDSEGNRIIDGMAGLWCVNIGYGRKELARVAAKQMEEGDLDELEMIDLDDTDLDMTDLASLAEMGFSPLGMMASRYNVDEDEDEDIDIDFDTFSAADNEELDVDLS